MHASERERFDEILERVLATLPESLHALLEEAPLIVEDYPDPQRLIDMGLDPDVDDLCGLHTGIPLTDRSVDEMEPWPETIHLYREGIVDQAGGWAQPARVEHEIRVTLLHEIGHHFGLEEDDLTRLGYE